MLVRICPHRDQVFMNESLTSNCSIVSGFILIGILSFYKNDLDVLSAKLISNQTLVVVN